jgi:hypothetical protein
VLIVAIGLGVRLWRLDLAPKGALIDELHFGYIAHSLNQTGADEHGVRYPVIFEGFGDKKLPAYAYLLMPFVKLLGLTVTAIRLPSLWAGVGLIVVMFFLVKSITKSTVASLFGAFCTAIIPWTFFLSRIGFESNIGLFFFAVGLLLLLKAQEKRSPLLFCFASILWALTWYSYIAFRPITVLLLIAFFMIHKLKIKQVILYSLIFIVAVLPLFGSSSISANGARFKQIGITNDPGMALLINEQRTFCSMTIPAPICYAVFNKPNLIISKLINRYLRSFSPQFLSFDGEDEEFLTVAGFGQLYSILYPLFLLGVGLLLLKTNIGVDPKTNLFILAGLLATPIPAILAGEPQKVRISAFFPFVMIATVIGFEYVWKLVSSFKLQIVPIAFATLLLIGLAYQSTQYFTAYFGVHVIQNEDKYQSYLPEVYNFIKLLPKDSLVVIKPFFSDPTMFFAFYTNYNPVLYQKNAILGHLETSGFRHTIGLDNLLVKDSSLEEVACLADQKNLRGYYLTNEELPVGAVFEAKSSNGVHTYAYIYQASECDVQRAIID